MKRTRRDVLQAGAVVAAGSLLIRPLFAGSLLGGPHEAAVAEPVIDLTPREELLFDFGWKFFRGHGSDPSRDLHFGSDQGDFAKTGDFHFAQPKFDDSKWRDLNLPHDWAIELPFVDDRSLTSHGYKPLGRKYPENSVGWYRRTFQIPKEDEGRQIYVNFDSAFRDVLVFCNGAFLGRSISGYAPFRFALSDFLNYGAANTITVRVDASYGDGWFYEGAGIYRHVWLTKTDKLHFGQWETVVRAEVQHDTAQVKLATVVENAESEMRACTVRWKVLDAAGNVVAETASPAADVPSDGKTSFSASAEIRQPAIWSIEKPSLYYAVAELQSSGKMLDRDKTVFGVRTLTWDMEKGFLLNGVKTPIQGTCNHQDHAGVGAALPDRLQSFRIEVLRGMGCNALRTSHNIPTPELIEACDRLGMLVLCETRIMSSNDEGMAQLETMIRRFRNHPSIFLWSMGNEEWALEQGEDGPRVIHAMQQCVQKLDPTRKCTAAVNGYYDKTLAPELEVMGFNYNLKDIDGYHQKHPEQQLVGTETASAIATRGIYSTDKLRNWVSAYDVNQPGWGETAEQWWKFYAARPWLSGGFAWTGFDYRGEPTPYEWPSISSQFGIVDTCGFPKDTYYYYKSWWSKEPVLHLFPHWNWEGREGETIMVWVHSNLDEVELVVNGESQGKQKVEPLTHLEWKVRYHPGSIEARGYKGGKVVLTDKRQTTGAPAKLALTADRGSIAADGEDIALIRVAVVDKDGVPVPDASNFVRFKITGEGTFLGVGNGDPNCQESDQKPERSLFNGLAQLTVQSSKKPGTLVIEASAGHLETARLEIATQEVKLRPAVG